MLQKWLVEGAQERTNKSNTQLCEQQRCFVALSTGYGKSFCYALLPAVFDHLRLSIGASIVICISPLTALMMEQRDKFTMSGIPTEIVGELQ